MMTFQEPVRKQWASAHMNADFLDVRTRSGYRTSYPDPEGSHIRLAVDSTDLDVGLAILEALSKSRFIHPHDNPHFFDVRGRVVPLYEAWVREVMSAYGYKNKRAMFGNMKSCSTELVEGVITMFPSHHEKLEAWSGDGLTESDRVTISPSAGPESVGAALRLAFDRCT